MDGTHSPTKTPLISSPLNHRYIAKTKDTNAASAKSFFDCDIEYLLGF